MDARWQAEHEEFNEGSGAYRSASKNRPGKSFRVFATQYQGYTSREVALPHRKLKIRGRLQGPHPAR